MTPWTVSLPGSSVHGILQARILENTQDWGDPLEKGMATHSRILPGESHGQRSLVDYSLWGLKESGMTKQLTRAGSGQNKDLYLQKKKKKKKVFLPVLAIAFQ